MTAAAEGDKAAYDKDVKGFVDLAFADMPRIPLFQPYVNVAMQKNVSGYQYWFHRRLDYRALVKADEQRAGRPDGTRIACSEPSSRREARHDAEALLLRCRA